MTSQDLSAMTTNLLWNVTSTPPADYDDNVSEEMWNAFTNSSLAATTEAPWEQGGNSQPSIYSLLHYKLSRWLWLYFSPVLIFGGGISNILAIIVLRSPLFRGTGTTFLLTALAVADLTVLLTNVLRHWIRYLTDYETDVRSQSDAGCRIHLFTTYFSPQWSAWTLVLVTAERAVSVWMPFKAKQLCSRRRIVIAWVLVSLIVAAVNAPILAKNKLFVYYYPQPDNTTYVYKICSATSLYYRDTVLYWSDFAMLNAGPSFLIFFFNIFIVLKLMRPQIDRQNDKKAKKAITSVTVMLFVVSIIFLVTTTPVVVFFLGQKKFFKTADTNVYVLADNLLTYAVCNLVSYINNSINFLLYFLSGGRFRKAMADVFCGRCMKRRPHSTVSKTNSSMVDDNSRISTRPSVATTKI